MKSRVIGRQATGFTLVELLVVIGIIGVLAALLLPAINMARESGRRTQCQNNVRNLAMAVRSYESQYGKLPAGRTPDNKHGFFIRILPNREETAVADRYDVKRQWNQNAASALSIPVFVCASVGEDREAITDYSPSLGVSADVHSRLWPPQKPRHKSQPGPNDPARLNGLILEVEERRTSKVLDGMSKTVLFVESGGRPEYYIGGIAPPTAPDVLGRWAAPQGNVRVNICSATPQPSVPYPLESSGTPKTIPPAMMNFINGFGTEQHNQPGPEIYSFHPGGANFAFGDGAVRFISDQVGDEALLSILTAQDGDIVDDSLLQ